MKKPISTGEKAEPPLETPFIIPAPAPMALPGTMCCTMAQAGAIPKPIEAIPTEIRRAAVVLSGAYAPK